MKNPTKKWAKDIERQLTKHEKHFKKDRKRLYLNNHYKINTNEICFHEDERTQ